MSETYNNDTKALSGLLNIKEFNFSIVSAGGTQCPWKVYIDVDILVPCLCSDTFPYIYLWFLIQDIIVQFLL